MRRFGPYRREQRGLREHVAGGLVRGEPALPIGLRTPLFMISILCVLTAGGLAVRYAGTSSADGVDTSARSVISMIPHQLRPVELLIDLVGEPLTVVVLVGLVVAVCVRLHRSRLAVAAVVGQGLTGIATTVLKPVVDRTIHAESQSYPSGHTAAATAMAFVVMLLAVSLLDLGRTTALLLIIAGTWTAGTLMAVTQVAINAHYFTDTIGGFCTAIAIVSTTALLVDKICDQPFRRLESVPGSP